MRGIRLQPLMDKAIPFLCYRLGAQVVWCRYNLTRSLEPTPEMPNPSGEMARLIKGLYLNVPLNLAVIKGRVLMVQKSSYPVEVGSLSKSLQGFIHQVVQDFFHQHCFLIGRVAYLATDYPRIRVSRFRPEISRCQAGHLVGFAASRKNDMLESWKLEQKVVHGVPLAVFGHDMLSFLFLGKIWLYENFKYFAESFRNCRATIQNPAKLKRGCEFYGSRKLITHPRFNSSPVKRDHFKRKVVFQPLFFRCHVSLEEQHLLPFGKKKIGFPTTLRGGNFRFDQGFHVILTTKRH